MLFYRLSLFLFLIFIRFQSIHLRSFLFIVLLIGTCSKAWTQNDYELSIQWKDSLERALPYDRHFKTKAQLYSELERLVRNYQSRGYLEISVDTLVWQDSTYAVAHCWRGAMYQWKSLQADSLSKQLLNTIGYRERLFQDRPFSERDYTRLPQRLLSYFENNGYPFAVVQLQQLEIDSLNKLSATLQVEPNELFKWGEITLHPPDGKKRVRINKGYISSYLGLIKNKLYDESKLQKISKRIRELPFLRMSKAPYIIFQDGKAYPHLFLDNQRASQFDVLIGLMPNDNPITLRTKVEFTGLINIDLLNSFGLGERIKFKWQQLRSNITELEAQFQYPYIARLPIGADVKFKLYKRDTTYLDIIGDIGVQYLFSGNNYLKGFWNTWTTNLITIDSQTIIQTKNLPKILDTRTSTFGIEYFYQNLDYRFNPRKGFELHAVAGFSIKKIRPNVAITQLSDASNPGFDFQSLYDSIALKTNQYRFTFSYTHFFPLWKISTLMARARLGWVGSPTTILQSELFRLGGNRFLRGFDEESIFANWYNVATVEWRFIFGTNSYAYLFGEVGYVETLQEGVRDPNVPYGFGVGVVLGTKIGLFGLSYALGAQQGNPLIIKNAKIHFGYVGLF